MKHCSPGNTGSAGAFQIISLRVIISMHEVLRHSKSIVHMTLLYRKWDAGVTIIIIKLSLVSRTA